MKCLYITNIDIRNFITYHISWGTDQLHDDFLVNAAMLTSTEKDFFNVFWRLFIMVAQFETVMLVLFRRCVVHQSCSILMARLHGCIGMMLCPWSPAPSLWHEFGGGQRCRGREWGRRSSTSTLRALRAGSSSIARRWCGLVRRRAPLCRWYRSCT